MDDQVAALERIVVGSVAITERAIAAAGADLTFVQWRVLLIVGETDAGATVGDVAARTGGHLSPASRLISRLRRRGVVTTERDRSDGRMTRVRLTPTGQALRTRVIERRRADLVAISAGAQTPTVARAVARLAVAFESSL